MKDWKTIKLEQRSPQWHDWRKNGIGASEARYLISWSTGGISPYLIKLKTVDKKPFYGNAKMRQGRMLEPEALAAYEDRVGQKFHSVCIEHREQPWLRASLDGLSSCGTRCVEIKCGPSALAKAAAGEVPHDYQMQMQYVMAITGFKEVDFWCYLPDADPALMTVPRDEKIIETLIQNASEAWEKILTVRQHGPDPD